MEGLSDQSDNTAKSALARDCVENEIVGMT